MSLYLLAPWALAASALLAIPVILHLFKPRRVRRTPFSSLRWLHLSPQKLSRRIQWHQVILFLLRAAFLTLLILALAKPLLSSGGQGKPTDRYIVLDVSHSMSYRASSQPTPFERARELTLDLVRRNRPGDRTAVLLCGSQTRMLTPLSASPENYLPTIQALHPGLAETDLESALPVLRGMMNQGQVNNDVEIWFLTDNQQHAWRGGAPAYLREDLPENTRIRVLDVGMAGAQNAWISRAQFLETTRPANRFFRVEVGCVGDATQERTVVQDAMPGVPERSLQILLTPGQPTYVDFPIPSGLDVSNVQARFHFEQPDALPADDEILLNMDHAGSTRVLLVGASAEKQDPGFPLRRALEALRDVIGLPMKMTTRPVADVQAADFQDAEVVFLMDVPELPDACLASLEDRVRAGAGLAIFLGDGSKPAFLNEKLYRSVQPAESLLPSALRREADDAEGRRVPITGIQWMHPILAGLGDPLLGDLSLTRFNQWYRPVGELQSGTTVLARIDDDVPAILDRKYGAGKVLVFNTGGGDRWSDLTKRNGFLPLMDRALGYLGVTGARRTFAVGELVTLALPGWKQGEAVAVVSPESNRLTPPVRALPGGRAMLTFEAAEAGIYKVERSAPGLAAMTVLAQVGRADSVLSPMDASMLKQWWAPMDCEVIRADDMSRNLAAEGGFMGLWSLLLGLAGLVLLAEMYLVHRLCPQANPRLVQNIVGRRTLVRHAQSPPE